MTMEFHDKSPHGSPSAAIKQEEIVGLETIHATMDTRISQGEMSKRDTLFADKRAPVAPFEFNEAVTAVFDDMIKRSVPLYMESIQQQSRLARRFYQPETHIFDLGCSHGNLGLMLHDALTPTPYSMIAVDSSLSMLQRYRQRLQHVKKSTPSSLPGFSKNQSGSHHDSLESHGVQQCGAIQLVCSLAEAMNIVHASVVIVNLTLQFIKPEERNRFIQKIYDGMVPGGILLLSEKVIHDDGEISELQREFYEQFKRANGYSDLEISRKRDALENILIPESIASHRKRLKASGFEKIDVWLKWFNFASLIAIK